VPVFGRVAQSVQDLAVFGTLSFGDSVVGKATQDAIDARQADAQGPFMTDLQVELLLGQLTCATRPPHDGVILMLQPCSTARIPTAPAQWLGPITNTAQACAARDWIEQGNWDRHAPPAHLRAEANLSRPSIRN
jgi:hypothetical protein